MNHHTLYQMLEIPTAVVKKLDEYAKTRNAVLTQEDITRLLDRTTWDEAVRDMQEKLGEDQYGIKALWEELNIACETYEKYQKKGIADDIFIATMKFCTRFLKEFNDAHGEYRYVWAWWFPRQLSMQEYRIGSLEFEVAESEQCIYIHIPSDADLSRESVLQAISVFREFCLQYYPEWVGIQVCCDSWLLSPALKDLLESESKIIQFQNMFEIQSVDYDSPWFMGWVYPGFDGELKDLPEKTRLQSAMKAYLLGGKKVGSARGVLRF